MFFRLFLISILFILLCTHSQAQCSTVGNKLVTEHATWKVGRKFNCEVYFERFGDKFNAVWEITELGTKFRMDRSDQIIFFTSDGQSRTFSFRKDSKSKINDQNNNIYNNAFPMQEKDVQWLLDNELQLVRFMNMLDAQSNTFRLHSTNKDRLKQLFGCLLNNIQAAVEPPPSAFAQVQTNPNASKRVASQPDPISNAANTTTQTNTTVEDTSEDTPDTTPQKQLWELEDFLLSGDDAAKKYLPQLEDELGNISDSQLKEILLNYRLGKIFFDQNRFRIAAPYLQKVTKLTESTTLGKEFGPRAAALLTKAYLDKQQHERAADCNNIALIEWNKFVENLDIQNYFDAWVNQGEIFKTIDASPDNLTLFNNISARSPKQLLKSRGLTLIKNAPISEKTDDYHAALACYSTAESLIPRLNQSDQTEAKIEVAYKIGLLYFENKNYVQAKKHLENAIKNISDNPKDVSTNLKLKTRRLLAETLTHLSELQKASEQLIKVDKLRASSLGKESASAKLHQLQQITTNGLVSYQKEGDNKSSLDAILAEYDNAATLVQDIRKTQYNEGNPQRINKATDKLCHQAILICERLYKETKDATYLNKAMYYAELSKGGLLFEITHQLESANDIPREEVLKENGLKAQLAYLQNELFGEKQKGTRANSQRIADLESQINTVKQAYDALLKEFKSKYPKYHQHKYDNKPLNIAELQKELKANEVFLQYIASDTFIYILAVSNEAVKSHLSSLALPLGVHIKRLQYGLRKNKPDYYADYGGQLYQYALQPVSEFIQGKKLIISPDAELYYIPFGTIPVQTPKDQQDGLFFQKTHYFIQDHPICYSSSVSAFLQSKKIKGDPSKQTIATWAPTFESVNKILAQHGTGESLDPLPGAQKEAGMIATMFNQSQVYSAEAASESQFKVLADDFNVLHIATHGLLNDFDPLHSSLAFTGAQEDDGLLNAAELYNMSMHANMAVLSACNSGMGRLSKEEGVISIASAFLYAGIPNVVMSKWPVSDWATQVLMTKFYTYLQEGMPKDEAMQMAKIEYLQENAERTKVLPPFFWGSFVIAGNNLPVDALIKTKEKSRLPYYGIVAFLLLAGGGAAYRLKKKQHKNT